jgi:cytochrome c556
MKRIALLLTILSFVFIATSAIKQSESPLSKLMKTMAADMKKARLDIVKNKKPKGFGKQYDRIKTAAPSSEAKKGEHFQEYAIGFLTQLERMKASSPETAKTEYNALAKTCVRCHETYCPGPISMLRKLHVP